jgi:hypothetical protein
LERREEEEGKIGSREKRKRKKRRKGREGPSQVLSSLSIVFLCLFAKVLLFVCYNRCQVFLTTRTTKNK